MMYADKHSFAITSLKHNDIPMQLASICWKCSRWIFAVKSSQQFAWHYWVFSGL